ncbi:MAG: tetratricopeptide repeat protein [Elusimicrobiota bacterium]|nr:tetratricopeptide repeat protein [Elusimicrobiota bacterium]
MALLFGIHPAHVESVAWAAERKDVLYAFFYLSSLIAYALRPYKAGTYLLSLALFICALLAKPMAVTLPLALLLIDYLKSEKLEVRHWLGKIPFFTCAAVFVVIQLSWLGGTYGMHWAKRLLVPLYNLAFYIYTLLWPFNLSTMYVVPPGGKPVIYIFAAGTLAGMFLLWKYFRSDKEIVFGAAFYVVMLLPVLQFFPFGGAISFDRFTYLSSIGIFIVGAVCARRLWRRPGYSYRSIAVVCTISAVLALAVTARVRCAVWKDGVSLWSDTLLKQPRAPYALTNLCDAYLRADMAGEAAACVYRSIQIYPENNNNRYNMCRLLFLNKEFDGAEKCFAQTLKLSPCHAPALNYLGEICFHKGEAEKAAQYYARAAQCDGAYTAAYLNLVKLALLRKDKAKAVQYYEKALSSEPADKNIRALLNAMR